MCIHACDCGEIYSTVVISIKAIGSHKTSKSPQKERLYRELTVFFTHITHTIFYDYSYSYMHIAVLCFLL